MGDPAPGRLGIHQPAGCQGLQLSERTVTKHLENIYLRLNVQSRTEAIRAAGMHTLVG